MRKQELLHIHGLVAKVAVDFQENEDMPDEVLDKYRDVSASPSSIHVGKEKHKEAIFALTSEISAWSQPDEEGEDDEDSERDKKRVLGLNQRR